MLRIIFSGLLFLFSILRLIECDYYLSNSGLDKLIQMEVLMVENLEAYINEERQRHRNLQDFVSYVEHEMMKAKNNSLQYYGNPLTAWKAIKRLTRDWPKFYYADMNKKNFEELVKNMTELETIMGIRKPVLDDLLGAARGIARIQQTYNLKTSDFANGILMGYAVSTKMSAADCYDLGMSLVYSNDIKNGEAWLVEARGRLAQETQEAMKRGFFDFPFLRDDMILDNLVPAVMKNGNTKLALWLIKEQLSKNPRDTKALENFRLAEQQLKNKRLEVGDEGVKTIERISDVELGGDTVFPFLRLAIPPIRGNLVIWYNLHRSLEPDYRTIHAACPVIKGLKWSCNVWYHTLGQELTHRCDFRNDVYKSVEYNGLLQK